MTATSDAGPLYLDASRPPAERAADLVSRMTREEKCDQLRSYCLLPEETSDFAWDGKAGTLRAPSYYGGLCYAHATTPAECAAIINDNQTTALAMSRFHIPVLEQCEALHGPRWCNASVFPQSIGLAATWNDGLVFQVAEAIATELRAGGIHQVFAPVVNIARDSRWGRTQETYGEDPYLAARMGVAYVTALERNNVIATPKHFAANFGDGGRDSNAVHFSERLMREIYFPAFKACFEQGHARSVMLAYNTLDGVPCSSNSWLMEDILRGEWGFEGFTVSDYGAVQLLYQTHGVAADNAEAELLAIEAGLDQDLPNGGDELMGLMESGRLDEAVVDNAVTRVLTAKFELGLFENPFVDADKANDIVRCEAHRALALTAARQSMVLLKNDGPLLPLSQDIRALAVFGAAKDRHNFGDYTGQYGGWKGDAMTPIAALRAYLPGVDVRTEKDGDVADVARQCDVAVVFASIIEEEASDRSNLDLPNGEAASDDDGSRRRGNSIILGHGPDNSVYDRQEDLIRTVAGTGTPTVVVLINGAAVTMGNWLDRVSAVLEVWYPGEQGGTAIAETLFGDNNPAGRLPITFPQTVGQLPLYYNFKPTGRSYEYNDNDGKPLFPFGYGLSYTQFAYSTLAINAADYPVTGCVTASVDVTNTGDRAGDEVVQLYLRDELASLARPLRELKGYKRISLAPGETAIVRFCLTADDLAMWNARMERVVEPGWFTAMIGGSCEDIRLEGRFQL